MTDWHPFPKQELALLKAQEVDELLYGGARGGAKTEAGIVWLVEPKYIDNPRYRGLSIRKNFKDLCDWIDRAYEMWKRLGVKKAGNPAEFTFPSGAKIRTGHLRDSEAYTQYQGHEYQKILIEELTQISNEDNYEKLFMSCRSTIDDLPACMLATTNPDGVGHEWVKDRFDCENPDMETRSFKDELSGRTLTRAFIPSTVEDNPILIEKDPKYVAMLNSIKDPVLRKQWRFGDWTDFDIEGAFYTRHLRQAKTEGRITTVPYDPVIPVNVTFDLGVQEMSCWFFQIVGREIHFIRYQQYSGLGFKECMLEFQKLGYVMGEYYMPHDISAREVSTATVREKTAKSVGMKPMHVAIRPKTSADGIQAVENLFGYFYFDKQNCKDGLWGLKNYKKEWDDERKTWKREPVKDWAKHPADSIQTLALIHRWTKGKPHNIWELGRKERRKRSVSSVTGY
jgi:hypothetical protein